MDFPEHSLTKYLLTTVQLTSTFKCVKCLKDSFKTAEALAAHQAALDHYQEGSECHEQFKSRNESAKLNHMLKRNSASFQKTKAARPMPAAPTVVTTTGDTCVAHGSRRQRNANLRLDITHGRYFIVLSQDEQNLLYDKLLAKCHSFTSLLAQGYRLTVAPPEKKPRKEKSPKEKSPKDKVPEENSPKVNVPEAKSLQNKSRDEKASKDPLFRFSHDKSREIIFFTHTPRCLPGQSYGPRKAIALDCEMVAVIGGQDELAFLSAIDFFTGEVLIHSYVQPTKKVIQWRSKVSGISPAAMSAAVTAGQALRGWKAAQLALWKYADTDTVLIGHCLRYDLNVLRIIHPKVVDSAILSGEPVFNQGPDVPLKRVWALKTVAKAFLDRDIQTGGKRGHDCLEDTYATRDVVIWCLRNPDQLTAWAQNARAEHELKMKQLRKQHEARKREKEEKEAQETSEQNRAEELTCEDLDNLESPAELGRSGFTETPDGTPESARCYSLY